MNKGKTENLLVENSDDGLNDALNLSEPINTANICLLVDFVENSYSYVYYVEDNNENSTLAF